MAKDLVIKASLDSSGVAKGADDAAKSLGQIKRQAELAAKGLHALSDDKALDSVKQQFTGLGNQIDKFQKKMTSGMGIKQQSRQISQQLAEVASAYRSMSTAEQQSTQGKWLRQYMNELTVLGGQVEDTIGDMRAQITAMASDTHMLAGMAEATSLMADGFTIAQGAASALGVSEKKLADIQKSMMSLMAMSNAAINIKNALLNQSALRTAILTVRIKAQNLATAMQVAMEGKLTTATKAAAAAQVIWNTVIKANPVGMLVTVLAAVVAGIWAYNKATKAASQGDIEAREALKRRKEELDNLAQNTAQSVGKQIAAYQSLRQQWLSLKTAHEQNAWITANKKAFAELGLSIKGIADAENVFVKNTDNFVKAMIARGKAAAYQSQIEKATIEWLEKREKTNFYSYHRYREGEQTSTEGLIENVDYYVRYNAGGRIGGGWLTEAGAAKKTAMEMAKNNREALETRKKIDQDYNSTVTRLAHEAVKATAEVSNLTRGISQYVGTTSTATGGTTKGGTTTTTTTKNEAPEGSLAALDAQINEYKKKMSEATTQEAYAAADKMRMELTKKRFWLDIQLRLGDDAVDELQREFARLPKMLKARNIKLTDIFPAPAPQTLQAPKLPNVHFDGIAQAQQDAQDLLDKTEGLRTAANAAASAFSAMGGAIGGSAGKAIDVAAVMAGAIATMIEGYAKATADAGSKLGAFGWLAFGLQGLAQLMTMIQAVKSAGAFSNGGIVGGTSFSGDRQLIRVNSGEMVLNRKAQRNLFNLLNGGGTTAPTGGKVEFQISGKVLKGVLRNYDATISKIQ